MLNVNRRLSQSIRLYLKQPVILLYNETHKCVCFGLPSQLPGDVAACFNTMIWRLHAFCLCLFDLFSLLSQFEILNIPFKDRPSVGPSLKSFFFFFRWANCYVIYMCSL